MKTAITLITFLALSLFGPEASAVTNSKLHLNLFNDGDFVVVVDGVRYTDVRGGLDIHNLRAGTHQVRIVEVFRGRGKRGQQGREVLYNGSVNIPFRSAVFARLTNDFRLRVTEVKKLQQPVQRRPVYRNNRGNRNNGGGYNAFLATKNRMIQEPFDRNRLQIAKQFVRTRNVTSAEVAQLMRTMSFDRSKVALAKFAYPFTIDQHNYRQVNRSFTFDSSVRELNRFLLNQQPRSRNRRR